VFSVPLCFKKKAHALPLSRTRKTSRKTPSNSATYLSLKFSVGYDLAFRKEKRSLRMKFLFSWLKEYIDIQQPAVEIAKILTSAGIEVDSIENCTPAFRGIVVGQVIDVKKHPNADKLCVATVSDGIDSFQVVCGAPNCHVGMKTAFAKVGAELQGTDGKTFKIKKSKLRDVESYGMLCSKIELQLGDEHDGIIEFTDDLSVGTDLADFYGDQIFEVSLTPNLGHCGSMIGIARELAAAQVGSVKWPTITLQEEAADIASSVKVEIKDRKRCPRYGCRLVRDVKIAPSPEWMQRRLIAAGLRPINNIVDITNYVSLEMGQPLHAFDYDRLGDHTIIVRCANEGEEFTTLDGQKRILSAEDLLICDKSQAEGRPIALAGVMGGANTEVGDTTHNILIEAANFLPSSVRRTSRRLSLFTDASRRFERSVDPEGVIWALDRAAQLMQQLAKGKIAHGALDNKEHPFPRQHVKCRLSRINQLLGLQLGVGEVEAIFTRLEIVHRWDGKNEFILQIPTYRADITAEIDIVEEVARIYGYDNIPRPVPLYRGSELPNAPMYLFEKQARSHLLAASLQEFVTCDLIGPTLLELVGEPSMPEEAVVKVMNPTSIEQSILRTSLLPGLLQVVKYNADYQQQDIAGFEIGRIHFKQGEQYIEQSMAGIILVGQERPSHWERKASTQDFFDLKGIVEGFLYGLGVSVTFQKSSQPILHPGRQQSIYAGDLRVGSFGELHPAISRRLGISERIYFAELNLHDLFQHRKPIGKVTELAQFPASERDWTVTLSTEQPIQEFLDHFYQIDSALLEEVSLLDLFTSDKLGRDRRNATFHFVYRDKQKTVAQAAVDAEHARLIESAMKRFSSQSNAIGV
jgi:phenylalanyl-tRNA synthetase beta chain